MASFIDTKRNKSVDFQEVVESMSKNSILFENSSIKEKYTNKSVKYMEETELNLLYYRNVIFEKYVDRLLYMSKQTILTDEQKLMYDKNPYLAAKELLGSPDYWWLLLIVNRKLCIDDFTKLQNVINIPDIDDLKSLLKDEFSKDNNIGQIIDSD